MKSSAKGANFPNKNTSLKFVTRFSLSIHFLRDTKLTTKLNHRNFGQRDKLSSLYSSDKRTNTMALLSVSTEDLITQQEICVLILVMRPAGE